MMVLQLRPLADYFQNSTPCNAVADIKAALAIERSTSLTDLSQLRAMQDWSHLNGRVVGAEEPKKD